MSEKLDGIRAYWDGQRFLSRTNKEFAAPEWFCRGLTEEPLDGELWMARGEFENTASIVMQKTPHEGWKKLNYMVYDLPSFTIPFNLRLEALRNVVKKNALFNPYVGYLEHYFCRE